MCIEVMFDLSIMLEYFRLSKYRDSRFVKISACFLIHLIILPVSLGKSSLYKFRPSSLANRVFDFPRRLDLYYAHSSPLNPVCIWGTENDLDVSGNE